MVGLLIVCCLIFLLISFEGSSADTFVVEENELSPLKIQLSLERGYDSIIINDKRLSTWLIEQTNIVASNWNVWRDTNRPNIGFQPTHPEDISCSDVINEIGFVEASCGSQTFTTPITHVYDSNVAARCNASMGLKSAELLVKVTMSSSSSFDCEGISATSLVCDRNEMGRPIVGSINICPQFFDKIKDNSSSGAAAGVVTISDDAHVWSLTRLFLHELVHIFAFDLGSIPNFQQCEAISSSSSSSSLSPPANWACNSYNESLIVPPSSGIPGKRLLVSPHVQAYAREHYNCSVLDHAGNFGLPLQGESSAHWDDALFGGGDIMGPRWTVADALDTDLTPAVIALLLDSGWYFPTSTKIPAFDTMWGKNSGCAVFDPSPVSPNGDWCISDPFVPGYCDQNVAEGEEEVCHPSTTHKAICQSTDFTDDCFIPVLTQNGLCQQSQTDGLGSAFASAPSSSQASIGELFSDSSRCLESSTSSSPTSAPNTIGNAASVVPLCSAFRCAGGRPFFYFADEEVECIQPSVVEKYLSGSDADTLDALQYDFNRASILLKHGIVPRTAVSTLAYGAVLCPSWAFDECHDEELQQVPVAAATDYNGGLASREVLPLQVLVRLQYVANSAINLLGVVESIESVFEQSLNDLSQQGQSIPCRSQWYLKLSSSQYNSGESGSSTVYGNSDGASNPVDATSLLLDLIGNDEYLEVTLVVLSQPTPAVPSSSSNATDTCMSVEDTLAIFNSIVSELTTVDLSTHYPGRVGGLSSTSIILIVVAAVIAVIIFVLVGYLLFCTNTCGCCKASNRIASVGMNEDQLSKGLDVAKGRADPIKYSVGSRVPNSSSDELLMEDGGMWARRNGNSSHDNFYMDGNLYFSDLALDNERKARMLQANEPTPLSLTRSVASNEYVDARDLIYADALASKENDKGASKKQVFGKHSFTGNDAPSSWHMYETVGFPAKKGNKQPRLFGSTSFGGEEDDVDYEKSSKDGGEGGEEQEWREEVVGANVNANEDMANGIDPEFGSCVWIPEEIHQPKLFNSYLPPSSSQIRTKWKGEKKKYLDRNRDVHPMVFGVPSKRPKKRAAPFYATLDAIAEDPSNQYMLTPHKNPSALIISAENTHSEWV